MEVNAHSEGTMSLLIQLNWMINDYRFFEIHWRILLEVSVKRSYLRSLHKKTGIRKRIEADETEVRKSA